MNPISATSSQTVSPLPRTRRYPPTHACQSDPRGVTPTFGSRALPARTRRASGAGSAIAHRQSLRSAARVIRGNPKTAPSVKALLIRPSARLRAAGSS